jgi:predicted Zn-dependent peptidase
MTTLDRRTPPLVHDAIEFEYNLPPINREKLRNGLPLYWLRAGVQDVVEIDWIFPAGVWHEPKPAVAHATAGLLKNGTTHRPAHEVHEVFESRGASLKVSAGDDWSSVTLYCLTKHLPDLLPVVREVIEEAAFPEDEVRLHKQNAIQRLMVSLRECEFVANQRIDALLFGEAHPYGRYSRREKIEAITREDLVQFHRDRYDLGRVQVFAGGAIGTKEVKLLDEVFGGAALKAQENGEEETTFSAPAPSDRVQRITNDPAGVQGAIRIGRLFPNRYHPDFAPMVVLNTLMGGYFGSRLMSNIREDKGYTYGIYSSLQPLIHGGSLIIHTEAGRDVCEAAVTEVWKELDLLKQEPADEDELLLVKNYLLGGLLGDLDGPFQLLSRWRSLILNGFEAERFDENIRMYKSITADALQKLAQRYYNREDFYEIVVV